MSISNRHSLAPFISGKSQAMSGQRLSKVSYKSSKSNPARYANVCVSLPMIQEVDISSSLIPLIPHIRTMLESSQDQMIKSIYESHLGVLGSVSDAEISISAIIGFLEAESTGGRLTKEVVYEWFDREATDVVDALIAEKLKYPMDNLSNEMIETMKKHTNAYRETFASLSGARNTLNEKQCNGLLSVLSLIEPASEVSVKLQKRIDTIMNENKKLTELADLIG